MHNEMPITKFTIHKDGQPVDNKLFDHIWDAQNYQFKLNIPNTYVTLVTIENK